ncbi:MAG: EAL domain-containing protein [Chloroflexota bacterium]
MTAAKVATPVARLWVLFRLVPGAARIWVLTGAMALLAAALFFAVAIRPEPHFTPISIPWWALAIGFYLAETNVVHLEFRRTAHTFSLSEIPLVVGLMFATPVDFVLANVVGAGVGLVLIRRQPAIKLAFNLSHFALEATLAVIVFNLLNGGDLSPGALVWFAAFAAAAVANVVGIVSIAVAIAFAEGRWEPGRLPETLKFGLAVGMTNTSLALMGVTILWLQPSAAWLLGIPIALVLIAYRTLMSEREKNKSLEFLYESTRILQRSPELDDAVADLLQHARTMFRAGRARLVLFSTRAGEPALETIIGPGDERQLMREVKLDTDDPLYRRALVESGAFLHEQARVSSEVIGERYAGMQDAMVAALRGDTETIGMLIIADRLGDVTSFVAEDLKLFETLANHAAMAFENGQLGRSLAQLAELKERLRHQAYHDVLTGLGNRALFLERLSDSLAAEIREGASRTAILFVDLDDFKTVNDSLGHSAGDDLLRAVAERLRACVRPEDLAVRLGGDEFGVLVEDGDTGGAVVVAQRILDALGAPFPIAGTEVAIRGSIGVAVSRRPQDGAEALVRDADVAMYSAKATGKGGYAIFQPRFYAAVVRRHALKGDLQRAVDDGCFVLYYQPIVDLGTGDTLAVEALLRWQHPARGIVMPADFIPFAEETGLILPIGRWVLEESIKQARSWEEISGAGLARLSVNVSARQVQQPGFVDEMAELVIRQDFPATHLTLEITETLMMQDVETTIDRLQQVRALGMRVALDDFGTGWSSMAWLREFPVDALKIPKEFLGGPGASDIDWEFARAIVTLAHSLRLDVIAEGIEYADQVRRLRSIGVETGQGFFFSPPVPAHEVPSLLRPAGPGDVSPVARRRGSRVARPRPLPFPVPTAVSLQLRPGPDRPH